jgi:hypothetical protein
MLTILVFEIKEEKTHKIKVKKILTIIYHYLLEEDSNGHVCGGIPPRKFLKFEARKCHFLHSEHPNLL